MANSTPADRDLRLGCPSSACTSSRRLYFGAEYALRNSASTVALLQRDGCAGARLGLSADIFRDVASVIDDAPAPDERNPISLVERAIPVADDASERHEEHLTVVCSDASVALLVLVPANRPATSRPSEFRPSQLEWIHTFKLEPSARATANRG